MNILGIFGVIDWDSHKSHDEETGTYTAVHDSGATLFIDGKLVSNILEERLTRYKLEGNFPYKSIKYCLSMGNISGEDIDVVYMPHLPCYMYNKQRFDGTLDKIIKNLFPNAIFKTISHHLCHAASSIFTSSLNEGTFFTLDGTGSGVFDSITREPILFENHSIGYFNKTKKILRFFPGLNGCNSFGSYHISNSKEIYFQKVNKKYKFSSDEGTLSGKIMGLCAYGDYNNSKNWKEYLVSNEYDLPFVSFGKNEENVNLSPEDKASVLQKNFESALLEYLYKLKEKSYLDDNICFAGGCFLNVLGNTLIKKSNLFENIHIPPFTNDSGISFGAAAYAVFIHENQYDIEIPENIALISKIYNSEEIEQELQDFNLKYKKYNDFEELCEFTSQQLNQNKIIGWFQNSSESGPRALGSRSLLMHPGPKENKDIMNLRVKHREYWRPFAGIILEEYLTDYFEEDFTSPYMLYSFKVKQEKKDKISAIIHEDNTCRIQTINQNQHPEINLLLKKFYKISGIPVILNTSFNDNGEPIVETPKDAIKSLLNMDIDYLVIGNYIVSKSENKKFNQKSFSYE
jgi:carbamoyltransferase